MRYGIIGKYGLAALLMSAAAVFEIRADRFDILSGDAAACNGALTESALGDLWQQNIRPETAAHRLLYLMSFQTVPSPLNQTKLSELNGTLTSVKGDFVTLKDR